jgi:hypothetical protein
VEYVERAKLELIAPMILQIWRLVFIRGSRFTTTMAVLYWVDWATVQYCHCWIYFRHTTEEKSHCLHAIQHAKEERSICKRDCATQGEANDYIDILTRLWGTRWTLRLMLDLLILTCLSTFLLGGLANSIPLAILGTLLCFYDATVLGTEAILRSQHRSEAFDKELFTSYSTLFALVCVNLSILHLCLRGGWDLTCLPRLVWVEHFFE